MFDLNPLQQPHASLYHYIMVQTAGIFAYVIGYIIYNIQKKKLEQQLLFLEEALLACRNRQRPKMQLDDSPDEDDLKEIAGIGWKIEAILHKVGIRKFIHLAETPVDKVRQILQDNGPLPYTYDPKTWPAQSRLAAEGRWAELRQWQEELRKGIHSIYEDLI